MMNKDCCPHTIMNTCSNTHMQRKTESLLRLPKIFTQTRLMKSFLKPKNSHTEMFFMFLNINKSHRWTESLFLSFPQENSKNNNTLSSPFLQHNQHPTLLAHAHTHTHLHDVPIMLLFLFKCFKCLSPCLLSANRNQLVSIVHSPNKRALWEFPLLNTFPF